MSVLRFWYENLAETFFTVRTCFGCVSSPALLTPTFSITPIHSLNLPTRPHHASASSFPIQSKQTNKQGYQSCSSHKHHTHTPKLTQDRLSNEREAAKESTASSAARCTDSRCRGNHIPATCAQGEEDRGHRAGMMWLRADAVVYRDAIFYSSMR